MSNDSHAHVVTATYLSVRGFPGISYSTLLTQELSSELDKKNRERQSLLHLKETLRFDSKIYSTAKKKKIKLHIRITDLKDTL